ncbi:hypothetical protein B0H19DRAFT_1226040 [Mycena capillaripes]|nr:hypothetical protein B0H19DRAFT_1226040 [Mycena capillaripes]
MQPRPPGAAGNLAHTKLQLNGDKPSLNDWGSNALVDHNRKKMYMYGGMRPQDDKFDPFRKLDIHPLPALTEASTALISIGGGAFFLLFGGYDGDSENLTNDLIAVDLDLLTWWFVDVQGTPLRPRMGASMVVTKYSPETRWTWRASDAPIPRGIPVLGYDIQATPVYGGLKILLTQGRVHNIERMSLSPKSTIFFHTENRTFQDARHTIGNFPGNIAWYSLVAGLRSPAAALPSAIIGAVVDHSAEDEDLVPELWQYSLPPVERIRCLGLREKLWQLDLDLREFVAVDNRLLLLGSEGGRGHDNKWDVAIEIASEYFEEE